MLEFVWIIPVIPLAGFGLLVLLGRRASSRAAAIIGAGSVGLSAVFSIAVAVSFISLHQTGAYTRTLWRWIDIFGVTISASLYLDALSLVMVLVVTVVGFLIHLYSIEFMEGDEGYRRFFAYMNLFMGSMLILVLADDLLFLYLGWEGVGLSSFLLIGFWYRDAATVLAARKAFIVTRIGDAAMAVGLFIIFTDLGTLRIQDIMLLAVERWPAGSGIAVATAALLLAGAVGKSAQLPLHTWLPDAMAGPTPVSALIHAATMVTAGVYLIARTNMLFGLAPVVQTAAAVMGGVTLLLSAFSALVQRDIKRVLAYSTISQIGYMFMALGVGAWPAAMFHLVTHAFFKALLFLSAGAVILSQHHEHDMFRMGGLVNRLPLVFATFAIGAASLSAFPLATAGFYSKELILARVWSTAHGALLWLMGIAGAFLTSLYSFRMVFVTFFGKEKIAVERRPGLTIHAPLVLLAVLSVTAGFLEMPEALGGKALFTRFLATSSGESGGIHHGASETTLCIIASLVSLSGIWLSYVLFLKRPDIVDGLARTTLGAGLKRLWLSGWGFDRMYELLFVRPYIWVAQANKKDAIDRVYTGISRLTVLLHDTARRTQTGIIRWYAVGIAIGAVIVIWIAVFI